MRTTTQKKNIAALAAFIMAAAAIVALPPAWDSDADTEAPSYDQDLGQKWSMRIQFVFTGKDAEAIEWDFGDGSEKSTDWHPLHEYAKTGAYFVKQTVSNSYDPDGDGVGSTVSKTFKVEVMGYPYIEFDSNGGSAVETIRCKSFGEVVNAPAAPLKEGYIFAGWCSDEGLTQAVDWSLSLKAGTTYYAKWTAPAAVEHTVKILSSDGAELKSYVIKDGEKLSEARVAKDLAKDGKVLSGVFTGKDLKDRYDFGQAVTGDLTLYASCTDVTHPDDSKDWAVIAVFIIGIVALLAFVYFRHPACIIVGIAAIALACLVHFGVIPW